MQFNLCWYLSSHFIRRIYMIPKELYYTKDHEWTRIEGKIAIIGITDYAQDSLGEITFAELPSIGKQFSQHGQIAVVESSKAASDVYSPLAGKVIEVNSVLATKPELINQSCYGDGWLCKIEVSEPAGVKNLMNASQYEEYIKGL